MFLGGGGAAMSSRPFAEATQAAIDKEVSALLREAEERAIELLKDQRHVLDSLVSLLLEVETVDGAEVYRLAGRPDRSSIVPPMPPTITWRPAPRRPPAPRPGRCPPTRPTGPFGVPARFRMIYRRTLRR